METYTSWVAIIGAVSGLVALITIIVKDIRRPRLKIVVGPYANDWHFIGTTQTWRFINFEVTSKKGRTARRCVARALVISHPPQVTLLRRDCALHWADVPYSGRSTGAEPVDIGFASHRLDVAFTTPNMTGRASLAMPIALASAPKFIVPQADLPQGEYIIEIKVDCDNGKGDSKTIKLTSPSNWQDLKAEEVDIRRRLYRKGKTFSFRKVVICKN